jgi:glycosyltransferase involved in cell wall biosynthesis
VTKPARVAFVTSHPIQYQAPLFRRLARRDDMDLVVLFCSDHGARAYFDRGFGATVKWDVPVCEGFEHVFLPNLRRNGTPASFFGLVNFGIGRVLRERHIDVVIVHGWAHATSWLAFSAASRIGIPLLVRGETNLLRPAAGMKARLRRIVLRRMLSRAAGALAIGSLNREFYIACGVPERRIWLSPYAVDNDFFQSAACELLPQRVELRRAYDIPADSTVFLFSGKLTPVKCPLDLLEAFTGLPSRDRYSLLFVGDGELRAEIEARVSRKRLTNVRVTGFKNQQHVSTFYAMADVLVLPSRFEPWGLVVNEAMNFGLGIVASDQVGGAADLVRPGVTGEIFRAGAIDELRSAMERCSSEDRRRAAARACRTMVGQWGIDAAAGGIAEAVRSVQGTGQ